MLRFLVKRVDQLRLGLCASLAAVPHRIFFLVNPVQPGIRNNSQDNCLFKKVDNKIYIKSLHMCF